MSGRPDVPDPVRLPPNGDPRPLPPHGDPRPLPSNGEPQSPPAGSGEVALHELGEGIAATVISIHSELAQYPSTLGAYVLDEMQLEVPVRLRMDDVGQVLATVTGSEQPGAILGHLRLRMRPVIGSVQSTPVVSGQSLASLGALSEDALVRLAERRIFSIDDLLRVSRNVSGRAALNQLNLGTDLAVVLDRALLVSLPEVPPAATAELLAVGVMSPRRFVESDPASLANALRERLGQEVTTDDVRLWQQAVRDRDAIPLPTRRLVPPDER